MSDVRQAKAYRVIRQEYQLRISEGERINCYICGLRIHKGDSRIDPLGLELDHRLPIAKLNNDDSANEECNLLPSHRICNRKKGTKILTPQLASKIRRELISEVFNNNQNSEVREDSEEERFWSRREDSIKDKLSIVQSFINEDLIGE